MMNNFFRRLLNISLILVALMASMGSARPVQARELAADFSAKPISGYDPLMVRFEDKSSGDPTGWAWYFGDEVLSGGWESVTPSGDWWSARFGHTSVVLPDGSIVLMGGDYSGGYKNDVWRSKDGGSTWKQMTLNAAWSARRYHTSVALPNGHIVLMGGEDSISYKNDVWRSMDGGATWTQVTPSGDWWSARYLHTSVVLQDGSILLMGGEDEISQKNDVWRSDDGGVTWEEEKSIGNRWSARYLHTSVVLTDGSILLMGGLADWLKNDVWRSTDGGASWIEVTPHAGWSSRMVNNSAVLPDGSIVLMGGDDGSYKNDVWRSMDGGETWSQVIPDADWSARCLHTSVVLPDGQIVLMGGFESGFNRRNDVWRLATAGSHSQDPEHTYQKPGTYSVTLQVYNADGVSRISKSDYIQVRLLEADFSATPLIGLAPLPVTFNDETDGSPTGWTWYFGDEQLSSSWEELPAHGGWSARAGHATVVLPNGHIVLMGGQDSSNRNDVWRSTDGGTTWTLINANAPWSARRAHTSVALPNGEIILMGGYDGSNKNDIWSSTDEGLTWSQIIVSGVYWSGRYGHTSLVLNNGDILLMGGFGPDYRKDVWRSSDGGKTWDLINDSAWSSGLFHHTSVVLPNGNIVLMGGSDGALKQNVWHSGDMGENWTLVANNPGWSNRHTLSSVALANGSIVLMGGYDVENKNDVWVSLDEGVTWDLIVTNAAWSARRAHSSVILPDGQILVIGGMDDIAEKNDVWQLATAGSNLKNPEHTYVEPGTYTVTLQAYNVHGVSRISKQDYIVVDDKVDYLIYLPLILR